MCIRDSTRAFLGNQLSRQSTEQEPAQGSSTVGVNYLEHLTTELLAANGIFRGSPVEQEFEQALPSLEGATAVDVSRLPPDIGIFPEPREVPSERPFPLGTPGRKDPFDQFFALLQMRLTYQEREFIQDLYRIGQQWNPSLECIRDGHYVYVPHWGPFQGFTSVDYFYGMIRGCLLYTSPSPRDKRQSRMPSSA